MATTLTSGATVLTPALVLPVTMTRSTTTLVQQILGSADVDITDRPSGPRRGQIATLWATPAVAAAAFATLTTNHGPWTLAGSGDLDMTFRIVGDVTYEPAAEGVQSRRVTIEVCQA